MSNDSQLSWGEMADLPLEDVCDIPMPKPEEVAALGGDVLSRISAHHELRIKAAEGFVKFHLKSAVADNNGLRTVLLFLLAELAIKKVLTPSAVAEMLRAAGAVAGTGRHEVEDLARRFREWSTGAVGARPHG
jgi:hypothetical protein